MRTDHEYDIVIIGSGIAGSTTAMVLSQVGLKTLVLEKGCHPRFAIGESTVPTTTMLLNFLADEYEVPELAEVGHYLGLKQNGCAGWAKHEFWYGCHQEGQPLGNEHQLMFEGFVLPNGPDVHMLRSDVDAFLVSRLEKYGVDYRDHTEILDFSATSEGVRLQTRGPDGSSEVKARFVVDASGHSSLLARRFSLRHAEPTTHTNTRTIFGHFEGVPSLDDLLDAQDVFRFRKDAGTMHHCFRGGWIWVIPFDNGTTSVGFELDRDEFPLDPSVSAEDEIAGLLERYPTIAAHLGGMRPLRPLVRTDRIQFTSERMVGPGFILTPHAAAFVEPLFSTGLVMTLTFCVRFARLARAAQAANDWNHEQFQPLQDAFFSEVAHLDLLIDSCISSGGNYEVYKQCWRGWVIGSMAQFSLCVLTRGAPEGPMLYGASVAGFTEALEQVHRIARGGAGEDSDATARTIHGILEPFWERICQPLFTTRGGWEIGSPDSCSPVATPVDKEVFAGWFRDKIVPEYANLGASVRPENALRWMKESREKLAGQREEYQRSRSSETDYHRVYDRILATQLPGKFDYRELLGLD